MTERQLSPFIHFLVSSTPPPYPPFHLSHTHPAIHSIPYPPCHLSHRIPTLPSIHPSHPIPTLPSIPSHTHPSIHPSIHPIPYPPFHQSSLIHTLPPHTLPPPTPSSAHTIIIYSTSHEFILQKGIEPKTYFM